MHKAVLLGAVALFTAAGASAQGPGAPYPPPGGVNRPPLPPAPRAPVPGQRWGSQVGGRWWGGANAPGGWAAYRQPYRGYRLPGYWIAPRFYVTDWSRYGLYAPAGGYTWVRYYDDAVLIDRDGQVSDWRGGLNWDGEGGYYPDRAHDGRGGPPPAWRGEGYPPLPPGHPPLPPGHPPVGPYPGHGGPTTWTSADGRTTVTTTTTGGGYYGAAPVIVNAGGYGGWYGGTTTVTVQSAPVVTTTTTEVIEDTVTYSRPAARRVVRHRVWHARPRCTCAPVRRHRAPAVIGS